MRVRRAGLVSKPGVIGRLVPVPIAGLATGTCPDRSRSRDQRRRKSSHSTLLVISFAVAIGFAAIEVVPATAAAYEVAAGWAGWPMRALAGQGYRRRVNAVADPFDLLALPAVLLATRLCRSDGSSVPPAPSARQPMAARGSIE